MNNKESNNSTGIGFFGLLTIVFIVLKLTKVIAWSWIWILSPVWIPTLLCLIVMIVAIIISKFK